MTLDLEQFRLPGTGRVLTVSAKSAGQKLPRHQQGERFLRGPIPWAWVERAARLPGRAWHVGTAIWFEAFVTKSRTIALSGERLCELGVSRHQKSDALKALERAGLIAIDQAPGCSPRVTLLDPKRDGEPDAGDVEVDDGVTVERKLSWRSYE